MLKTGLMTFGDYAPIGTRSNELDRCDILAFYTAPSTELFAQLAALDARSGTRNSIALRYVDRFNQTCGRNRGSGVNIIAAISL